VLPGGKRLRPTANLYVGGIRIFCGPRWEDMAGRLISGVRDLLTTRSNEFVWLRAAGVVIGGRGLILPSAPNPHLPALAALLARAGAGYLGDEVMKFDPILRQVHGVSLPLLVDVADLGYFPELGGRARRILRGAVWEDTTSDSRTPRRPIPVNSLGGHGASPTHLGRITFPVFAPGEETRLEPIAGADAVFRLMQAVLNAHIWTDRAMILARDLVETVPVNQLIVGAVPDAADLLMSPDTETVE
jgi:hypothetical protein